MNYHVLVISLVGLVAFICASVALLRLDKGNLSYSMVYTLSVNP